METTKQHFIGLVIPQSYYRALSNLRFRADRKAGPITNRLVYHNYRNIMDSLTQWLLDFAEANDYGTAFRVIRQSDLQVLLQPSDCPFDCYWTMQIVERLSDEFRFGGLLDQWRNDT